MPDPIEDAGIVDCTRANSSLGDAAAPTTLRPFHEAPKQALKSDAHRPRHKRGTALALYAVIKEASYAGVYARVTDFIRAWRAAAR